MRKLWIFVVLITALLLAACAPQSNQNAPTAIPTKAAIPEGPPMECTLFGIFPDARDPVSVNLPLVSDNDWTRGSANPRMTLVEYSDFQCPYCSMAAGLIGMFEEEHAAEVQVVFRHFPLTFHDKSALASQAAEAAGAQGKFWEMHDFLFAQENWETWTALSVTEFETWLGEQAGSLGLDVNRFNRDLNSEAVVKKVQDAYTQGIDMGIQGTPSLYVFLDGELIFVPEDQVPYDSSTLSAILELTKLRDKQYDACPPMIIDSGKNYTATLKTEKGDIKIKLYADSAPLAVNNFVFLAQMGYFNDVTFHRVLPGFVAQSGDPSGTGFGGPGYVFASEVLESLKFDRAGLVGMANSGPDSNGSQFFITYDQLPNLDGGYTIFGEVIEGQDIAESVTPRDPATTTDSLPDGDRILSITIEEN
jgi:cyclophilin family peptidyl-prolyl cis-trans isomerase/protein-disulfide isomerase